MSLGLLVGFAAKTASNYLAGDSNRKSIEANNTAILLNNISVMKETAQEVSGLLAGQVTLRMQASDALRNASTAGMLGIESGRTEAAAAGVTGSSIDAVQMDAEKQAADAKVAIEQSVSVEQFNMSQRLRSLISGRKAQLGTTQRAPSRSELFTQSVVGSALNSAEMYANAYFKFGG